MHRRLRLQDPPTGVGIVWRGERHRRRKEEKVGTGGRMDDVEGWKDAGHGVGAYTKGERMRELEGTAGNTKGEGLGR